MKFLSIFVALIVATVVSRPNDAAAQRTARSGLARSAPRGGQSQNRWRYAWHNGRWWYWTTGGSWSVFDGRRWLRYDPRRPAAGSLAAGYRKAPAFESPPAAAPQPPRSWSAEGVERETGLANSYYLQGGATAVGALPMGGEPLPVLGGPTTTPGGVRSSESAGTAAMKGPPSAGGGAFGGPKGGSLGAGSAAGGASTPQ